MTLSEMLDALEGGIVALHADRAKLASALSLAQHQPAGSDSAEPPKRRRAGQSPRAKRAKPKAKAKAVERADPAAGTEPAEPPKPPVKRRQALGTSLSQLLNISRRQGTPQPQEAGTGEPVSHP